jgi:hypothetical protein
MGQFNCVGGQYKKELEKVLESKDLMEQRNLAMPLEYISRKRMKNASSG